MPLCFDEIFLFQDSKAKVQGMMLKYPWLTLLWSTIASKDFQMLENCERSGKKNTGNMSLSQTGLSTPYYINVNATSSINKGSIFQYFLARKIDFFSLSFACYFSRFGCNSEFYFIPKKVLHDMIYIFSSKCCSFDQNTYFFSQLVRAILEQNTIPRAPLDRKKMKKIRVDRLPSTRIFTMG